jgi:hypothetical protein
VAPLKLVIDYRDAFPGVISTAKSRGSIEAKHSDNDEAYTILFPRLKSRGPIEAQFKAKTATSHVIKFPRLKSRGPIEAVAREDALARYRLITSGERRVTNNPDLKVGDEVNPRPVFIFS